LEKGIRRGQSVFTGEDSVTEERLSRGGPQAQVSDSLDLNAVLRVLHEVRNGDFTVRLPVSSTGLSGQVADSVNEIIAAIQAFERELARVGRAVGKGGSLNQRVNLGLDRKTWVGCADSVNGLIDDLVRSTTEMARVIDAVAEGDLSHTIVLETHGRPLEGRLLANATTVNTLVNQLCSLLSEIIRLADQVGSSAKPSEQVTVHASTGGVWKDLADSVNHMAGNLTRQVGDIAELATAAANGELSKQITIDQRNPTTEALLYQTLHDPLTGLPNRTLFNDRLNQALLYASRDSQPLTLLMIDVDELKDINDRFGHDLGDALLAAIAERLTGVLRVPDTVARMNGDEFAILPAGPTDLDGAAAVAWKVLHALEAAFVIDGHIIEARVSIGIALFPLHGADPRDLLRRADLAMREAKRSRSGFAVFAAIREKATAGRLALMGDLRHCIARDELVLHYQPKVDLARQEILGVEALVRWQHPIDGLLGPDLFVPLAERSGLIAGLTRWVLNEALQQLQMWREAGLDMTMAVNLSSRSLESFDIVDIVAELSETWGIPPDRLHLEITESGLINAAAPAVLQRLHEMGERLCIDDFGTGYSSLANLQRLPVDEVKIDKSFVIDLGSAEDNATIVRSTIDLGHNLGLTVCAEGVEDDVSKRMLIDYGCDVGQGFLISRARPAGDFLTWLAQSSWEPRQMSSI
jgi:diguanylate cyclase (GGDEF)-like protein